MPRKPTPDIVKVIEVSGRKAMRMAIPKSVIDRFNLKPGDEVEFVHIGYGRTIIVPHYKDEVKFNDES